MRNGVEQRIAQAFTFARSLHPGQGLHRGGTLDGNGRESAHRVKRLGRSSFASDPNRSDRAFSEQNWNESHSALMVFDMIRVNVASRSSAAVTSM